MRQIVIGSRGSRLALTQTGMIADRLKRNNPGLDIRIEKISTAGDRNRSTPLDKIPDVGFFVKELEEALLDKRIDVAVHSLKDMPTDIRAGLIIAAIPEREDPRDVLVSGTGGLSQIPAGSKIGTSSVRRAVQLAVLRPDLDIVSLRGNVDTRLRKVETGELAGVVMAAAGLIRLGWQDRIIEYLPQEQYTPPAGQGALAIEVRADDTEMIDLVSRLDDSPSRQAVTAERAFLKELGGGCRAPIAALGQVSGKVIKLSGMVADPVSKKIIRASLEGAVSQPEKVGIALAEMMRAQGAAKIVEEVKSVEAR